MNWQNLTRYKTWAFTAGLVMLTLGLCLEYVPILRSNGESATIPQANAVCSGVLGAFIQGMARTFAPGKVSELQHVCTLATTGEHFIGPLIVLGVAGLVAGLVLVLAGQNTAPVVKEETPA